MAKAKKRRHAKRHAAKRRHARRHHAGKRVHHAQKTVCGQKTSRFHDVHKVIGCETVEGVRFGLYPRRVKKRGGGTTLRLFARRVKAKSVKKAA